MGGGEGRTEENVFFFGKLYLKRKRKRDAVLLFISGHDPKWPTDGATVVVLAAPTGTSFAYRPHVSIDKRPGPLGVEEIPPISRTALETPSKRRVIDSQLSTSPSNLMNLNPINFNPLRHSVKRYRPSDIKYIRNQTRYN